VLFHRHLGELYPFPPEPAAGGHDWARALLSEFCFFRADKSPFVDADINEDHYTARAKLVFRLVKHKHVIDLETGAVYRYNKRAGTKVVCYLKFRFLWNKGNRRYVGEGIRLPDAGNGVKAISLRKDLSIRLPEAMLRIEKWLASATERTDAEAHKLWELSSLEGTLLFQSNDREEWTYLSWQNCGTHKSPDWFPHGREISRVDHLHHDDLVVLHYDPTGDFNRRMARKQELWRWHATLHSTLQRWLALFVLPQLPKPSPYYDAMQSRARRVLVELPHYQTLVYELASRYQGRGNVTANWSGGGAHPTYNRDIQVDPGAPVTTVMAKYDTDTKQLVVL
jgi:hypothetical protein